TKSKVGWRELQAFAEAHLQTYMTPARWVEIDTLPLTSNGKLDERALPVPSFVKPAPAEAVAPRTATERYLVDLWEQVLGMPIGDLQAAFFELGGDSLQLMRL